MPTNPDAEPSALVPRPAARRTGREWLATLNDVPKPNIDFAAIEQARAELRLERDGQ